MKKTKPKVKQKKKDEEKKKYAIGDLNDTHLSESWNQR